MHTKTLMSKKPKTVAAAVFDGLFFCLLLFRTERIHMKTMITVTTLVSTLAFAPQAMAGEGGHCHVHGNKPASEALVQDCADQRLAAIVKSGKLDASWRSAKQTTIELVEGKKGKEWKVRYANPAAADKTKQTLFVFFAHNGNFIAANFTGE